MKISIFLVVAAIACANAQTSDQSPREQFADYVSKFGKQYDEAEYFRRMTIFSKALLEVEEHNTMNNAGWIKGMNKFSDMTPEELARPKIRGQDVTRSCLAHGVTATAPRMNGLPTDFDWRDKGVVSKVRDQGSCGSCWAFSTAQVLESAYAVKYGKLLSISPQELVDCSDACSPEPPYGNVCNSGCGGGWPWNAMYDVMLWGGIATEDQYPYAGMTDSCERDPKMTNVPISNYTCLSGPDTPSGGPADEADMKAYLVANGPLSISLMADFLSSYEGGIFETDYCQSGFVDHCVLLVGYGTENGVDYWTVKNSWGPAWGEEGYFRIKRGENMCGIASGVIFPLVK